MTEMAVLLVACGVMASLLPAVWSWSDRGLALTRLPSAQVHCVRSAATTPPHAAQRTRRAPQAAGGTFDDVTVENAAVDDAAFYSLVARAVRAGSTTAEAISRAPSCSPSVTRAQRDIRDGSSVIQALQGDGAQLMTLAACIHHGTLSVDALEHAARMARSEDLLRADIRTALALARRSALMLTSAPVGLLGVAAVLSGTVRSALATPVVTVAVAAGFVLNRSGLRWMTSSARSVMSGHMQSDRVLRITSAVASHLRAGGTLTTAVERLAPHDFACAETNRCLAEGLPLGESLGPLQPVAPGLVRALLACARDGLPAAPAVDSVTAEILAARAAAARVAVAELPARGTAPLVLLVLPSFLLLAVVPLAIAVMRGLAMPQL